MLLSPACASYDQFQRLRGSAASASAQLVEALRVSAPRDQARGAEQLLVLVAMALVAFGVVMVYSASSSFTLLEHDVVYAVIGLAALWRWPARTTGNRRARAAHARLAALLLLVVLVAGVSATARSAG